jgi:hypothetical protein
LAGVSLADRAFSGAILVDVTEKPTWGQIQRDRDERVTLPLDPDEALSGLMEVDPESEPAKKATGAPRVECPSQDKPR